jgi:hypothetical protein
MVSSEPIFILSYGGQKCLLLDDLQQDFLRVCPTQYGPSPHVCLELLRRDSIDFPWAARGQAPVLRRLR